MLIYLVLKEEISILRAENFSMAHSIPGTRNYHDFIPLGEEIVSCKMTSYDTCQYKFNLIKKKNYNWSLNTFVSFVLENQWKIGLIIDINDEHLEITVSLLRHVRSNEYEPDLRRENVQIPYDHVH